MLSEVTPLSSLRRFALRPPQSVVFIEDGNPFTAAEVAASSERLAAALRTIDVERVAIYSDRPSVLAACLLAAERTGKELLILRYRYPENDPFWSAASVGAVIDEADFSLRSTGEPSPPSNGLAVLIPTSGTSGVPKISRHLLPSLMGRIRTPKSDHGEVRWLLTYQPHGFAGLQIVLTALATEASLVSLSAIDVPRLAAAALDHHVTHISGTPTFWRSFVLSMGWAAKQLALEQATLGGEVVDQATLDRLRETFPAAGISHIYASTEAGALFSVRDGRAGFPARWLEEPVDGVSLRIRDGILQVQSPRAMSGYIQGRSVPLSEDGWFITGDRVQQTGDRVHFLGREDAVINVGGGKVTPEEVESALMDLPGIQDLRAYPVSNPITGFVVGLEVVAAPGVDQSGLRQTINQAARKSLPSYKVPRLIRFVDSVASDASGKKSRKP